MQLSAIAESPRARSIAYAGLTAAFFLAAVGMGAAKAEILRQPFDLVVSDGRFYYAYLPSLILDHDLDFTNQITEHWGTDFSTALLDERTPTGLVNNKYPIGLALTLAPAFLLGHLLTLVSAVSIPADGYSWPYQLACLALIEAMVWRTLVRFDALLTQRFGIKGAPAFAAVSVVALGTPYAYYVFREPFMVHAVSTFWCTEMVAAAAWAGRIGPLRFWLWLGLAGGMAIVCRPTNAVFLPVALFGVIELGRHSGWNQSVRSLPLAAIGIVPLAIQMGVWRCLSGRWLYYSYGGETFNWMEPALWQTLFSSRHGLFFWSPILLLACAGLTRVRDSLIGCWLITAGLLWYANSAWHCWWFGDAFGGRAFLELSGLFAVGLAVVFARLQSTPRAAMFLALFAVVFNFAFMLLYITHRIPRDNYLFG